VLSLATFGTETKTHTGIDPNYGGHSKFLSVVVHGFVLGEVVTNIVCMEMCLKFSHFEVCSHVIVAVGNPLPDASCRLIHDLFCSEVFYQDLKNGILTCFKKYLVHCSL